MNSFSRVWRSLVRKPVKSLLLFAVVMAISLLLLCGLSVRAATVDVNDSTRQAVGASFLLETNAENRAQRLAEASAKIGEREGAADGVHQEKRTVNGQTMWQTWTDHSFESLQLADIDTLAHTAGISDYTITTAPEAVRPLDFARIEDTGADHSGDAGGVALIGERAMRLNANVAGGILALAEGRWIQPEDSHVCVISEALAGKNGLAPGDQMTVQGLGENGHSEVMTVIGIFREVQPMTPYMSGDTYRAENVIFCDLDLPEQVSGEGALYAQAVFAVADVDEYDAVKTSLQQAPIDWSRYDLIDKNGDLETMAANFGSLSEISDGLLIVTAGAGLALLFVILAFWGRSRRHELGILCALGESRCALWWQILCEALIVSVFAVAFSFAAGPVVSDAIATKMATVSAEQDALQAAAEEEAVATDHVAPELSVQCVSTALSPEMLAVDATVVGVLVTLSVTIVTGCVLRRKPQELLQTMR